jgi:exopolysaccharide biosynthesis polyprenyl glycosylphosphotransferase
VQPTGLARALVLSVDLLALLVGLLLAHAAWQAWQPPPPGVAVAAIDLLLPNPWSPPLLGIFVLWLGALRHYGLYDPRRITHTWRLAAGLSRASALAALLSMNALLLLEARTWSRFLLAAYCLAAAASLFVGRLSLFYALRFAPRPIIQQRVAIIGVGEEAARMSERLARYGAHAYALVGFFTPPGHSGPVAVEPGRILGPLSTFAEQVNRHDLRVVILTALPAARADALTLATQADAMGVAVWQVPFTWGAVANTRVDIARLGNIELINLTGVDYPSLGTQLKRALDLLAASALILLLAPALLAIGLLIKLQDGGPVLYVQERSGKGGRTFPFFKLRTMVVGADALRDGLPNEADGVLFKLSDDPRITRLGRFLRRSSIDELPQLWNVLRGDMNLVGPRPLPMADLVGIERDPELQYWYEMRSRVKPGITGPWQVSGRSDASFREMMQHDIAYIQDWSLWLDLLILLRTLPAVLRGRGAR